MSAREEIRGPGSPGEVVVAEGRAAHAVVASDLLAGAIREAVAARGRARIALSGGTTPSETYQRLASLDLPFASVDWFWVDERGVPPDSPRSNYGAAAKDLGLGVDGRDRGRAYRMEGERPLDEAARAYDALLRKSFGVAAAASFDAITLGVGDDGHTASLFPGIGATSIDDRLVAHIRPPPEKKLEERITLTAPVLLEAKLVLVLARGASKRGVVAAARAPGSEDDVPARILQRAKGHVIWVLDAEAAP